MTNTPPSTSSVSLSPPSPPQTPPQPFTATTSDPLRRLLDETSDLIDSPTFTHIHTLLLDTLFSHLTDHTLRSQAFKLPTTNQEPLDPNVRVQDVSDMPADPMQTKAKLATILAVATRQAHVIGNGVPNQYVQAMEGVRELEAFAAVVYSSNFAVEGVMAADVGGEGVTEGGKARMVDVPQEGVAEGDLVDQGEGKFERVEGPQEGIMGAVAAKTWGVWESVWGRVVGASGDGIVG